MATLNINGQRVKVDDAFLKLSPEEQQKTVEEIAKSLPSTQPQAPAVDPEIAKAADAYEKVRGTGAFAAATDSGATGIPFSDELYSAVSALPNAAISAIEGKGFHPVDEYNRSQALQAELQRRREEQHPIASTAGAVAGGIGATAPVASAGYSLLNGAKPTIASLLTRGAGEGAIYGGIYGAGEGNGLEERLYNAAKGAVAGGVTGGALGGVGAVGAGKIDTAALPTAESLRDAAAQAYQRADDAGVIYSPDALKRVASALEGQFADFGYHPQLQPGAKVALGEIQRLAGGNTTLKGVDTARKIAGNAFQPGNASNNALTSKVTAAIDDLVQNPQAGDIIAGNGQTAADAITEARTLYGRARKLELVNALMERAGRRAASTGSGGNVENATRQELNKILNSEKMKRGFTPDELEAIRKAVVGTKGQDVLRLLGKFSPTGNGLMAGLGLGSAGTAGAVAGPLAAIPSLGMMALGYGSRKAAEALARNNARVAEAVIASGGKSISPTLSAIRSAIVEALTRGAAQQLPDYISP